MNKISIEELFNTNEENIFSTGFKEIDEFLQVEKGSVITIGSKPAMGKTSFALSIVNHLLEQNKKVFYFSPSMSAKMILKRLIVDKLKMERFILEILFEENKTQAMNALEYLNGKELFICDKTNLTVEDIETEIKENTPDVVFIDYIQLLNLSKAPDSEDYINLAVHEIKRIANETGVIFVILSQLSMTSETRIDKRPLFSGIKNSSLTEELSNVVILINSEEEKILAEIIFVKNDFGTTGTICLKYMLGSFSNYR